MKEKKKSLKNIRDCTEGRNESCRTIDCRRQQKVGQAIAKEDFTEAHVASPLIDGARKKLEKAKTEDDQNVKKRKEINEKKGKMIDYLSRSHKESKK